MKNTLKTAALTVLLAVVGTGCEDGRARTDKDIMRALKISAGNGTCYLNKTKMNEMYPAPQDLEVQLRDMNEDGKYELTVSYGTNDYLLRAEGTNVLRLIPFLKEIRVEKFD